MKFKMLLSVALTAMLSNLTLFGTADMGDINVCTNVCAGSNISCKNQYLNCGSTHQNEGGGLGDLLNSARDASDRFYNWGNLKSTRTENLGIVKGDMMNFSTSFPSNGQKKMIQFTATTGQLSGKKISLLFVSFDLQSKRNASNTPKALGDAINAFKDENKMNEVQYQSAVHIFGQVEGGPSEWYHAGSINLSIKPDTAGFDINMQVMADGKIVITDTELLQQTGADGAKARIAPIELDFSKVPEMLSN
jgi:hypothetical protein